MLTRLRQHWERGRRYKSRGTWVFETYHRVMSNLFRQARWPGCGKVIKLHLIGQPQPFFVRLGTSDFTVMDEIFTGHEYDRFISSIKDDVNTIVDLGANIGMSVRRWQQSFPNARIVAVEPDSENVRMIHRNAPKVETIQACIASSKRTVQLDRSRGAWGYQMAEGGSSESIPTITLAEIPGEIDILKCDIEGAEREVFADCRQWIGRVRNAVIEIHSPYSVEDLKRDLERAGAKFAMVVDPDKPQLVYLLHEPSS